MKQPWLLLILHLMFFYIALVAVVVVDAVAVVVVDAVAVAILLMVFHW